MDKNLLKDKILEYLRNSKTKYHMFQNISKTFGFSIDTILHILYDYKHTILETQEDDVISCLTFKDKEKTIFYSKSTIYKKSYRIEIRENFCSDLVYEEHVV